MSAVTDPLVKNMKKNVYHLTMNQPVTDQHEYLHLFCEQLEMLFRRGMKPSLTVFQSVMHDYWRFFEAYNAFLKKNKIRCHPFFDISIQTVKSSLKVKTDQGRGRLLIRMLLQNKCLDNIVHLMNTQPNFLDTWYSSSNCIFFDPIQTEIFISVLKQMNELQIKFCVDNQSFLDDTWILPVFKRLTLVPSKKLGVEIIHKAGHAIVFRLNENGVAAENGQMEAGDVLDEICNKPLRDTTDGLIPHYLRCNLGKPIDVTILKGHLPDGSIFRPLLEITKDLPARYSPFRQQVQGQGHLFLDREGGEEESLKTPPHARLSQECDEEVPVHNANDRAEYDCTYLGYVDIGQDGSICKIEEAIDNVDQLQRQQTVQQQIQNKLQEVKQQLLLLQPPQQPQQQQPQNDLIFMLESDEQLIKQQQQPQQQQQQQQQQQPHQQLQQQQQQNYLQQQQKQLENQLLFLRLKQQQTNNVGVLKQFETLVHLGETDFTVFDKDKQVFLKASFTEISACGRKDDKADLFACIIGETTCTLAKNFVAHVFKARNHAEAKIILCTIEIVTTIKSKTANVPNVKKSNLDVF
ncbi:hypothetical protein HELRODRAFT_189580 [Helobdella robusta]|uniref:RUN domain-containing protein n=1 Tax=Helobdella robusta TaxID=6412 RepID=T1FR61_HELRO|nr:hypothetical protein HELRODRAFT_189580 [Helobdella robusta]ESN92707.1 hypothetical protein HELRODRAFT_189580 [Helobdella robusta]